MLPVLDQLLGTFFELLKNMYLTWIASVDKKVGVFRKLGVVCSAKFSYSRRFALVPCTVYLVRNFIFVGFQVAGIKKIVHGFDGITIVITKQL